MGVLSLAELKQPAVADIASANTNINVLSKSDETDAIDIFADAFVDDPVFAWIAGLDGNDPKRKEKMYRLCSYVFGWNRPLINGSRGVAIGIMDRENNNNMVGCMAIAPSSCHKERIIDMIRCTLKSGVPPMYTRKEKDNYCANSGKRLQAMSILTKKRVEHMQDTMRWLYLRTIGVRTEHHGNGYGKQLLQTVFKIAGSLNVPLYLETESKENEAMYQHFGFRTLEVIDMCVPGDESSDAHFDMYLMRRDPLSTD